MTTEQKKAMAERIKKRRISLGFTQEQFCEIADLSISSYTKIENTFQNPTLDTLIKIARHLDFTLDYIVFGDEKSQKSLNMDVINVILKNADREKMYYALDIFSRITDEAKSE